MLKKGPNRRIYDTVTHTYHPASDVRERVVNGETVYGPTTKDDVSRVVLLRIISYDLKNGHGPDAQSLRRFIQEYSARKVSISSTELLAK